MSKRKNNGSHDVKALRRRRRQLRAELRALDQELDPSTDKDIEVTGHAIVRFLERVDGLDVQAVVNRIVTEKLREQVEVVGGTGKFPCEGGQLVMENKRIITVKT